MKSTCIDFHPYVRPQDNGNKTDVRWMALSNDEETGLLIVGMPLLSMSALHYTMEDLDPGELTERNRPFSTEDGTPGQLSKKVFSRNPLDP